MLSEKQKMLSGALYDASDKELTQERIHARRLLAEFNRPVDGGTTRTGKELLALIPQSGANVSIQPPFYCDYGINISLGESVYMNFNCVVLDVCQVTIGSRTLIGPAVQIYAATHPMSAKERASGLEAGKPVTIGEDVWIGGAAIICPGVTIGDGAVIGAGAVVTKDIPARVFAAGNPARVIRQIEPDIE